MTVELACLITFLTGLIVGGSVAWLARGDTIKALREHVKEARTAEALATDRLVHAWREGAQIPPRPTEPGPPPQPLPRDLADHIAQWDDPEHRAEQEAQIRALLATGRTPAAVLMHLENQHP